MTVFHYGNQSVEYEKIGQGQPLILLLGMNDIIESWLEVIGYLKKYFEVYIIYRPGIGKGNVDMEKVSIQNTAVIIESFIQNNRLKNVILMGHSYGGLCIQAIMCSNEINIARAILIDSSSVNFKQLDTLDTPILNDFQSDDKWLNYCSNLMNLPSEKIIKRLNVHNVYNNPRIYSNFYKTMYTETKNWDQDAKMLNDNYKKVNIPLLIIGRDLEYASQNLIEENIPVKEAYLFERKWRELIIEQKNLSSKSEVHFIESSTHNIHIDQPKVLAEIIKLFCFK